MSKLPSVAIAIGAIVFVAWRPGPAVAVANPLVSLTFAVTPSPAADDAPVTFTATATPVGGTPVNVTLYIEGPSLGGTCTPAEACSLAHGYPEWSFATLESKVTLTWNTSARTATNYRLWVDVNGYGGCANPTCPLVLTIAPPTLSATISTTTLGPIHSGDTIHLKAVASTNAGPVPNETLQVRLGTGLANPTSVSPAGAEIRAPPANDVTTYMTLANSATLEFDAVVIAADGADISVVAEVFGGMFSYAGAQATLRIHIGSAPTAPPSTASPATARPSAVPTTRPTTAAAPTPTVGPTPTATPLPSPTPGPTSTPTLTPTVTAGPLAAGGSPSESAAAPGDPGARQSAAAPASTLVLGILVAGIGAATVVLAAAYLHRHRRLRQDH